MKIGLRKQKRKIKRTAALAGLILIMTVCALFENFAREDSLLEIVLRQAKSEVYLQMLKSAAPVLFYEKENKTGTERLFELIFHTVPVYGYITDEKEYTTQSESEISYETIIAREASDENYVDEKTGEVVTGDLQKETTEPAAEEVQTEGEAQTEQPASNASFVPNDTPVTTYAMDKLNDFDYLIQNFYVVDRTTTINSSQLNAADLLNRSMKLTHGPESPQILIYHTHSQERFADSVPGDPNTSIVGALENI